MVSKNSQQNNNAKEMTKERYISPEQSKKTIDNLRWIMIV